MTRSSVTEVDSAVARTGDLGCVTGYGPLLELPKSPVDRYWWVSVKVPSLVELLSLTG